MCVVGVVFVFGCVVCGGCVWWAWFLFLVVFCVCDGVVGVFFFCDGVVYGDGGGRGGGILRVFACAVEAGHGPAGGAALSSTVFLLLPLLHSHTLG